MINKYDKCYDTINQPCIRNIMWYIPFSLSDPAGVIFMVLKPALKCIVAMLIHTSGSIYFWDDCDLANLLVIMLQFA